MAELARDLAAEVADVVASYRLAFQSERYRGRIGARRGHGPGSSLEFHDFRDYAPGDDLRHVDWTGYARTDQLRVRLHEAEVAPIVEVLVDDSPSMALHDGKLRCLRGLAAAIAEWGRGEGSGVRLLALDGGPIAAGDLAGTGGSAPRLPRLPLRPGSVRVLLTDGLWPDDPRPLVRKAAAGAARFVCVQLLDPSERRPEPGGAMTLVDCETGARSSLLLDERAIARYVERLDRLCGSLFEQVLAVRGLPVAVTADNLPVVCRRDLLPAGLLLPA